MTASALLDIFDRLKPWIIKMATSSQQWEATHGVTMLRNFLSAEPYFRAVKLTLEIIVTLQSIFKSFFFWTCVIVRFLVFKARGAFQSEGDSWALARPATTFQITEITHKEIDTYTHRHTPEDTCSHSSLDPSISFYLSARLLPSTSSQPSLIPVIREQRLTHLCSTRDCGAYSVADPQ